MMQQHEDNTLVCLKESTIQTVESRCLGIPYHTRRKQEISDVTGRIVGESSLIPAVYIQDKIIQMREASSLSLLQRCERLKNAAQIYEEATLANLKPEEYVTLVTNVTGLPQSVIRNSLATISCNLHHIDEILQTATPAGAVWEISDPEVNTGCSLFSRRGDVVSIIAAGNGPGVHALWPQAIAMGYRTLVRPSCREPFTAQRLVYALEQAGLEEYTALIPTDYKGAETLIAQSDLAIVYGGPEVADRYCNNPRVLVQGPGRSKIVVGKDICHDEAVAVVAQSVLSLGGAACVSASAVLVEDGFAEFAEKLRQELKIRVQSQSPPLGRQQEVDIYEELLKFDDVPWIYDRDCSQGYHLIPHVSVVKNAFDSKVQRELPFPCVTVAPFNSEDAYKALSNSLVVTVLSRQMKLINKVVADTTIANVYVGNIPTTWMDYRVPHDGYLADFLMCNRGIRVDAQWLKSIESIQDK
jgi:acyl-CoA reductase-like NAD-dependent aldehyde dehydrogenase